MHRHARTRPPFHAPFRTTFRAPVTAMVAALAAAAAIHSADVGARSFPSRPVKIVIGFPPGSAPDVVARTIAETMAPDLGQPVVVENRTGAGGTIATTAVATALADGHTLNASGCSGDSIVHAFVSQGRPPLGLFKDLTPVGRLMRDHWLVVVPADSPAASLQQLGAQGRAAAEPLAFPSPGDGTTPHLQAARLAQTLGFKGLHVAYKESPVSDLVGGRLAYAVYGSVSMAPLVKSARLKALAVLSTDRLPALPDVPTAIEAGLGGYAFNGGICLWTPGGTPDAVQARLNDALNAALRRPEVLARFAGLGADPVPSDLEATRRYVSAFAAESDALRTDVLGTAAAPLRP
jgi:tripartite-type tricarboxylate transporter receptor subunit TctC